MPLTKAEAAAVEARVRAIEAGTGAQVVVAIVERSDVYHGLRWRAFAFGAALAALTLVASDMLRPDWITAHAALFHALAILGGGALLALIAHFSPAFARLFLERHRAQTEVRQYAQTLFLERELFATKDRNAVLILASRYERVVVVWPDTGFRDRVAATEWRRVVDPMLPAMRAGRTSDALAAGLAAFETLLAEKGCRWEAGGANVFADRPIETRGA
jgi:putative membrane protein